MKSLAKEAHRSAFSSQLKIPSQMNAYNKVPGTGDFSSI